MAPICSIESVNNKMKLSLNKIGITIDSIQPQPASATHIVQTFTEVATLLVRILIIKVLYIKWHGHHRVWALCVWKYDKPIQNTCKQNISEYYFLI